MRPSQPPRRLALHSSQIPDDYLQQCTITSAASGGRKARTSHEELTHVEGAYAEANEKAGTEEGRAIAEATFRQRHPNVPRATRDGRGASEGDLQIPEGGVRPLHCNRRARFVEAPQGQPYTVSVSPDHRSSPRHSTLQLS